MFDKRYLIFYKSLLTGYSITKTPDLGDFNIRIQLLKLQIQFSYLDNILNLCKVLSRRRYTQYVPQKDQFSFFSFTTR